ncbi:Uncharacterised protein [Vibrio cholerae]|nr:Uncharacterised protein [Vibrio cholerae]
MVRYLLVELNPPVDWFPLPWQRPLRQLDCHHSSP